MYVMGPWRLWDVVCMAFYPVRCDSWRQCRLSRDGLLGGGDAEAL